MSNVLPFKRPVSAQRADGVFAAINVAARRMGYSDSLAYRAARQAKQQYQRGKESAAKVVSDFRAELRLSAEPEVA
ncbi:hypothetical protein [Lysobacter fragariae]